MSAEMTAERFIAELETYRSDEELEKIHRYFKLGDGEYGAGDIFIGVRMGQVFDLAKKYIDMPPAGIEKLLESNIHEVRAGGMSIMDKQGRRKKTTDAHRKELYDLYMRRHDRINNWDLVDLAAIYVVGGYLADKPRDILYTLARSENMWERRTAIYSTLYFIMKQKEAADSFKIAEMLLGDDQDLIHKATGGVLRAAGDVDRQHLLDFLDAHAATMPRVMLRYAVEHLDPNQRSHYMGLKKGK